MDNKLLLMEYAKELFYAKGYDAVGVQEIVERAGLTKPTLYYYFGSKLGLLKTLLETKFERYLLQMKETVEIKSDIRDTLYRLAKVSNDFYEEDREFYMLMMALFYSAQENEAYQIIRPFIRQIFETVVSAFDRESGQLGNMHGRQRQFAIGFIGTVNHYLILQREIDTEQPREVKEERLISVVNQFMYGIFT